MRSRRARPLGNYVKNVGNTNDAQCAVFPDNSRTWKWEPSSMQRQRLSPDPLVILGEVFDARVDPLRGPDFAAVLGFPRASTKGLCVHVEILAAGAGELGDIAGLGAPGSTGPSIWVEAGSEVVLSNIVTSHQLFLEEGRVRAVFELWFPLDLSRLEAPEPDIVLVWPERTAEVRRLHLTAEQLHEAARASLQMGDDGISNQSPS